MTISDRLQEIRERAEKATAGPWSWNSYNRVDADAFIQKQEDAEEAAPEGCEWPNRYSCGACVIKQGVTAKGKTFPYRACAAPIDLYEADSRVCSVPASHGDTATSRHAADAEFIAASREDIPWLLQLVTKQENEIAWLRTWIFRLDSNFESAAKKIMASNTDEPMTIEQVKEFLGIDPGSAFGTPGTAD